MYRVLGGNRTNPCAGTRDDGARARTNAEHLVIEGSGQLFARVPGPTNTVRGNGSRAPYHQVEAPIVAKVKIKPLEDKILVQANEAETTTASGLVIPDTAKEKPQEGTVVAVGPGRWDEDGDKRIPVDVSEGDTVIYSKYGGTEIKYNGEEYLILSARDVLAVVNK
jgi:chaperonin GroES